MFRRGLEQGAREAGFELTGQQVAQCELFVTELKKWNQKINLTAITSDDDIAIKHIIDSLFVLRVLENAKVVLDVGSGPGFPAIPLKIMRPDIAVVAVDAVAKKIHFQRQVARLLQFKDYLALHDRVEALHAVRPYSFDLVVSRAFADLTTFASLAAPLLAPSGRLVAMKGPAAEDELAQETPRLLQLGLEVSGQLSYELPFHSGCRCLLVLKACEPA